MRYYFLSPKINAVISSYADRITSTEMNYSLYVHIVPKEISNYNHDKFYVGITSRSVLSRWKNGLGYKTQMFYRAIEKYGWDNLKHIVLLSHLTKNDAENLEKVLIFHLKSNYPQYGYNITSGGLSGGGPSKKIAQYDLSGNFINSYPSLLDATVSITGNKDLTSSGIRWALSEENRTWKGYMWREYDSEPPKTVPPYKPYDCKIPVLQYDIHGNFLKKWNSLKEPSEHYNTYSISNACRHLSLTAVGFQWRYETDKLPVIDVSSEIRNKLVYVYDIDGSYIGEYESITSAVKELHIDVNRKGIDISSCYSDIRRNCSHGYRWCNTYYKKLPPLLGNTCSKMVVQLDGGSNKILNIFHKIKDATEATGECHPTITNSCKRKTKTKRNYCWRFLGDISNYEFQNEEIKEKFILYTGMNVC